jgi:endonuclease-3 related protein
MSKNKLLRMYKKLLKYFGPQAWWPADSPFEVIVGAILTQNTNWKNVEKAIENLKKARLLSAEKILKVKSAKLEELIRPTGYFRQKARRLKEFVKYFTSRYGAKLSRMKKRDLADLRQELLNIHGIGPETADSILLYALDKPTFVVDAYTRRIGQRLGLFKFDDYHAIKDYFERNLFRNLEIYKEFHALLVELAKNFCKTKPMCAECPLVKLKCQK